MEILRVENYTPKSRLNQPCPFFIHRPHGEQDTFFSFLLGCAAGGRRVI